LFKLLSARVKRDCAICAILLIFFVVKFSSVQGLIILRVGFLALCFQSMLNKGNLKLNATVLVFI
jgi:hypothetical protein